MRLHRRLDRTGPRSGSTEHDDAEARPDPVAPLTEPPGPAELRHALAHDELVVHYQPQLDLRSLGVVGVEALVRWQHPERGLLVSGDFLGACESDEAVASDLDHDLTHWVLEQALDQARRWQDAGHRLSVSVNLSARGLGDDRLAGELLRLVDRRRLLPADLVLEVPASAVAADPVASRDAVDALAHTGALVALDGFGTAGVALSWFADGALPLIKLDRSLVSPTAASARHEGIVAGAVALAHHLGTRLVAQGVEDEAVLDHLTELGCDLAQGFFVSRPKPADELTDLLADFAANVSADAFWGEAAAGAGSAPRSNPYDLLSPDEVFVQAPDDGRALFEAAWTTFEQGERGGDLDW